LIAKYKLQYVGRAMKPLEIVYWIKFAFGFVAALTCLGYAIVANGIPLPSNGQATLFFNSVSISIIMYVLSYYVVKAAFKGKVAKTSKLLTTGIGIYFLSWIVFYVMFYTAYSRI
jgi:hypothetical protein